MTFLFIQKKKPSIEKNWVWKRNSFSICMPGEKVGFVKPSNSGVILQLQKKKKKKWKHQIDLQTLRSSDWEDRKSGQTSLNTAQMIKRLPAMWETQVWSMEKEMTIHSSTLTWKIPWTEEPGRLQSMGPQRVGQDWAISIHFFDYTILKIKY